MKEPTISGLKKDLAAANAEAGGYLSDLGRLRGLLSEEKHRNNAAIGVLTQRRSSLIAEIQQVDLLLACLGKTQNGCS